MLTLMRRETSSQHIRDLIRRLRKGIPGLTLRTTFIVGFPGETEDDFQTLLDFIEETKFERLGVFKYSQEEGSRAAKMENHLPQKVKDRRWNQAMKLQQKLARQHQHGLIGKDLEVLVDAPGEARSMGDAPEIDGKVLVPADCAVGEFVQVRVVGAQDYDVVAEVRATVEA
jgi:ribosomal protein S12 methylthiotransferase